MIPEKVTFTGLTVPSNIMYGASRGRKQEGPWPATWARLVEKDSLKSRSLSAKEITHRIDAWLEKHIQGSWGLYYIHASLSTVFFFQDENDAILFKLMGGMAACLENTPEGEAQ